MARGCRRSRRHLRRHAGGGVLKASAGTLAWLDRLVWTLVYGGLFALILGLAALPARAVASWSLIVIGALLVAAGVILIWVRARVSADR